jgi:hypothetical protein
VIPLDERQTRYVQALLREDIDAMQLDLGRMRRGDRAHEGLLFDLLVAQTSLDAIMTAHLAA